MSTERGTPARGVAQDAVQGRGFGGGLRSGLPQTPAPFAPGPGWEAPYLRLQHGPGALHVRGIEAFGETIQHVRQ